tara:strand:+ start:278 stop:1051 length:774 start_codon:yes stop_codon:yes gene_type:complete
MYKIPLLTILLIGISLTPLSFSEGIPEWVKNNASWWSEREISQTEFVNGLEFLINEGIIYIPSTEPRIPGPDKIIPDWVRNTAGWWSDNKISDSEFINAMKYLIKIGIIEVDVFSPELIVDDSTDNSPETSNVIGKPLHMLLEGYRTVIPEQKFAIDVKVFYEEDYSLEKFGGGNEYILEGVTIDLELHNEEELIHTFSGITENTKLRYEILARETSQDGTLWMINNLYTVHITASLDGQTIEKTHQFYGIPYYDTG